MGEVPTSEGEIDETGADRLVHALQRIRDTGKKSLIRSTDHNIILQDSNDGSSSTSHSALIEETVDDGVQGGDGATTSSRGRNEIILTSWKTQEFAYRKASKIGYDDDDALPTLARGLFTSSDEKGKHRIVVRGYDKFFNEGEMPWTKPECIAAYSRPPYDLSFKENGCIIFIAALSNHQLIVTSKHSLGANESSRISHAEKGEEWLGIHLRSVGKTKQDLAQQLWHQNETAVAELCDDTFEEHVLAYPVERTGLHLHGLNANTAQFQTRSMKEVEAFAGEWGFLSTRSVQVDSMEEVVKFTSSVAETGRWQGTALEGFVVRTRMPTNQDPEFTQGKTVVPPPYMDGQTWFYKVKFDEPYLMYRDWRELTKKMMTEREAYDTSRQAGDARIKRPEPIELKKKRAETRLFVLWCHEKMYGSDDGRCRPCPELFAELQQNKGIIRLRDLFLEYLASPAGKEKMTSLSATSIMSKSNGPYTKTLLVPIAIPGCGKTALAVALTSLFPMLRHIQSDDVQTKKTGPTFLKNVGSELEKSDVIFADRNNHLFKHRDEIVKSVKAWESSTCNQSTPKGKQNSKKKREAEVGKETAERRHVRMVAIVWQVDDLPLNHLHHLCSDRLVERGDNHQSLRVESGKEHEQILWQFLQTRQAFKGEGQEEEGQGDSTFDDVIHLDVKSTLEESVAAVATQLAGYINVPIPTAEQVHEAAEKARHYRVSVKKELKTVTSPAIRYYGISLDLDLVDVVKSIIAHDKTAQEAFAKLVEDKRTITRPHVTLVHNSEVAMEGKEGQVLLETAAAKKRWHFYSSMYQKTTSIIPFKMEIDCLAWDDRAMSLGISNVTMEQSSEFESLQGKSWRPHITVGTFHEDIRPYEGNRVLCEADSGSTSVRCIHLEEPIHVQGRLKGLN
ncbi:hypothetical protein CBS101457_006310 [Exobasidium rhododendri]|nr:hypothetical protein CBS101457_006310 [Exobasidium rhododendri]